MATYELYANNPRQQPRTYFVDAAKDLPAQVVLNLNPHQNPSDPDYPGSTTPVDNATIRIYDRTGASDFVSITTSVGDIWNPYQQAGTSSVPTWLDNQVGTFVWNAASNRWFGQWSPNDQLAGYTEVWSAVATDPLDLGGDIQFTFVELFPGQAPVIATYSEPTANEGLFTFQVATVVRVVWKERLFANIRANNTWAEYSILPTFSGAGTSVFSGTENGVPPSSRSASTAQRSMDEGRIQVANGDTLKLVGTSDGSGGSGYSLDSGFLFFELGY